jgi:hypothetical protein
MAQNPTISVVAILTPLSPNASARTTRPQLCSAPPLLHHAGSIYLHYCGDLRVPRQILHHLHVVAILRQQRTVGVPESMLADFEVNKVEQDMSRREQALANAPGMRVLQTIVAAVPVRLMKRDFLFIVEQMLPLLDDKVVGDGRPEPRHQGTRSRMGGRSELLWYKDAEYGQQG